MAATTGKTAAKPQTPKKTAAKKTGTPRPRRTLNQRLSDLLDRVKVEQDKLTKASENDLTEAFNATDDVRVRALIVREVKARRARRSPLDEIIETLGSDEQLAATEAAAEDSPFGLPAEAAKAPADQTTLAIDMTEDPWPKAADKADTDADKAEDEGDSITAMFGAK